MSNLESSARPILSGMIKGNGRELHKGGQRTIATWAFLRAVMLEQVWKIRMIPPEHYRQLYERPTEPPDDVFVWIAGVNPTGEGQRLSGFFEGRGLTLGDPDEDLDLDEIPDGYAATFSVNHVVVKVYGHRLEEDRELVHHPVADASMQRIWPLDLQSFVWPPGPMLDGPSGLRFLASGPVE